MMHVIQRSTFALRSQAGRFQTEVRQASTPSVSRAAKDFLGAKVGAAIAAEEETPV